MTAARLANSASAYLRSAAHQPIDWYPWSDEAFAEATRANRPILLDIGAVWCHWCHVMDSESYDDPELARYLNDEFVCIKVDRDERPDVDARYQRAVQALAGQGGWPLTAFLTPGGEVFYGGTYFPPDGRYGRPSFRTVLESVLEAFRERRERVDAQATALRNAVENQLDETAPGAVSDHLIDAAVSQMVRLFDPRHGGFGTEPKFPHPSAVSLLITRWADNSDPKLLQMIERTLDGMARGGIHDQLGGGFHRYSVDARWTVPHFEKMLYDNAELLRTYTDAGGALDAPRFAEVARSIIRWVRQVAADPEGGYAASQDADIGPDDDGSYFTWTREEAAAVLPPDELEVAELYYDIGTAGEMPHDPSRNVLFIAAAPGDIASQTGRTPADVTALLARAREKLKAVRDQRTAPFVDRSRYTGWNAMMISALLRAAPLTNQLWARDHAVRSLRRIREEAIASDAVGHLPGGRPGLLEDQVQTAAAAVDAWELTGDTEWLAWAEALTERAWTDYHDDDAGGLFDTAANPSGAGLLPARAKSVQDSPAPSPNGTALVLCARLHAHTGKSQWRERADELARTFAGRRAELGLYGATYLQGIDWLLRPPTHLVIVGAAGDPMADAMHQLALASWYPRRVVQRLTPDDAARSWVPAPLAAMLHSASGTRGYICTGTSCQLPAQTESDWAAALHGDTLR